MTRMATITLWCDRDEDENVPLVMSVRISPNPAGCERSAVTAVAHHLLEVAKKLSLEPPVEMVAAVGVVQ